MYLLRDYHSGDASAVDGLAVLAFLQYRDNYSDWPAVESRIGGMSKLAERANIFVAESAGRLVGAVAYLGPGVCKDGMFNDQWAAMRMLVVTPEFRGHGIGRALADLCLKRAEFDGARIFALHTSPIMHAAMHLYNSMGFQQSHAAPAFHGVSYDVFIKLINDGLADHELVQGYRRLAASSGDGGC